MVLTNDEYANLNEIFEKLGQPYPTLITDIKSVIIRFVPDMAKDDQFKHEANIVILVKFMNRILSQLVEMFRTQANQINNKKQTQIGNQIIQDALRSVKDQPNILNESDLRKFARRI